MPSATRQAIACIFCIFNIAILAQSQTTPVKDVTSSITGRVTIKDKPVQGVAVGMRTSQRSGRERPLTYKGTTDVNGDYRIANVPPGNYVVRPLAPADVTVEEFGGEGRTLIVNKAETIEHFDFALMRGAAITGKVVDADGRPVVEQEVQIFSASSNNNRMYEGGQALTDDRGVYRAFGLRPGSYKVGVGQGDGSAYGAYKSAFYKRVYHPSTNDLAQATVIELSEGGEATNVDITLGRALNTFTATGRIVDDSGQPIANVNYGAMQFIDATHRSSASNGAITNSRGEFKLENLVPGKYAIVVRPGPTGGNWNVEEVPFEIVDEDVTGLVVRSKKGAIVSGVVVLEGADDKAAAELFRRSMVTAMISTPNVDRPSSGWSQMAADGSFTIAGLATGTAYFNISSPSQFQIVRIERNGVVQPRSIEIREGEPVNGLRIVVNYGNASIRGVVEPTNGTLPPGARFFVYLRKVGEEQSMYASSPNMQADVDIRGQFIVQGLLPGTYEITAGAYVRDARVQVVGDKKQQIEVGPGSTNNVTIQVDLTPVTPRPQ